MIFIYNERSYQKPESTPKKVLYQGMRARIIGEPCDDLASQILIEDELGNKIQISVYDKDLYSRKGD